MATARRGFLKSVAAVPLAPSAALASSAATPFGYEGVAEALAEAVRREFGQHVDAGELDAVRKALAEGLERSARLRRAARLSNADEPVGRFEARPPEAKGKNR